MARSKHHETMHLNVEQRKSGMRAMKDRNKASRSLSCEIFLIAVTTRWRRPPCSGWVECIARTSQVDESAGEPVAYGEASVVKVDFARGARRAHACRPSGGSPRDGAATKQLRLRTLQDGQASSRGFLSIGTICSPEIVGNGGLSCFDESCSPSLPGDVLAI